MERRQLSQYLANTSVLIQRFEERDPSARHRAIARMREDLAAFIAHSSIERFEHGFHVEHRLRAYVIPPDELHRLIQEEAMRLTRYLYPISEVPNANPDPPRPG